MNIFFLKPLHSLVFRNTVLGSNSAFAASAKADSASWPFKDNVEVHTENTGEWVILDTQIDVLLNTKSKASCIREVSLSQFSILDLKTSFKDFISLFSADGDVCGNLFVSLDSKASDGIPGS